uniref:Uncharacterized protein n=1 Tax=Tanacetum cinerariifolium TaxID=118510 RepID=A0A6L2K500_TANCI|nr:hypothetical protein [Tanacetum cinerariifolium]
MGVAWESWVAGVGIWMLAGKVEEKNNSLSRFYVENPLMVMHVAFLGEFKMNSMINSFHPTCYSGDENSFAYDSTPNLVKDSPNVFNLPSQPPMYSYEFCGDDAHYSYDCPPQVPFIYDPEPSDCDPEEEIRLNKKLLYDNSSPHRPKEFISKNYDAAIKSFSPSPILVEDSDSLRDEIDLSLTPDDSIPPGIEDDDHDSEGDILILEEFLSNDSFSLPENESFHFDIPSSPRPLAKPPDDDEIEPNLGILTVKVVGDIFEHYVPMPRLLPTQPTLTSNQEKSPHLLSYRGLKAFKLPSKIPMMIYGGNTPILDVPFLHFYPP